MAIAWVYRVYLNPDWLWTVGAPAQSECCFQCCAICPTGAGVRYGNLSAAHRGGGDVVEDAGNDIDLVGVAVSKYENKTGKKTPANMTVAAFVPINKVQS